MNALRRFIVVSFLITPIGVLADEKSRDVVPYCDSSTPRICEMFLEYLKASPDYRIVPVEDRRLGGDYLHVELQADWLGYDNLQGRVVWWGKAGSENRGVGVSIAGAPKNDRAYANLAMLALSSSGITDPSSAFYNY
jgi:hypothetical protein